MNVGEQWQFYNDENVYTVKAANERYAILTTRVDEDGSNFYTIVDHVRQVRGCNNWIFNPYDYTTDEGIAQCMNDLINGEVEVSFKNCVRLLPFDTKVQ